MNPVSGDAENGLGGAAEVPGAAVPRLALQSLRGAVPRQAVQAIGAAVPGLRLVVEARHASVGQPVVCRPEAGRRVPGTEKNRDQHQERASLWRNAAPRPLSDGSETHLPSRERCRLPW